MVKSCNTLLHVLLVCIRKLSKISSKMNTFNFGCLSSWQSIFMWARMWESIVIVNAKRGTPSKKFGKHLFRQYWAGTRFWTARNLIPITSSNSLVMLFHSTWNLLCFQRIYEYIVILYYNFVHHSDDVAWSFPSLVGEWEINCFHPPSHSLPIITQGSSVQIVVWYANAFSWCMCIVCLCVCVCVCVYLTSAHASDLLDRSRQISRGNTQQRKSVVRYTCHQWKVILHRFFALNVLGLDGTMLRINISSCLE